MQYRADAGHPCPTRYVGALSRQQQQQRTSVLQWHPRRRPRSDPSDSIQGTKQPEDVIRIPVSEKESVDWRQTHDLRCIEGRLCLDHGRDCPCTDKCVLRMTGNVSLGPQGSRLKILPTRGIYVQTAEASFNITISSRLPPSYQTSQPFLLVHKIPSTLRDAVQYATKRCYQSCKELKALAQKLTRA